MTKILPEDLEAFMARLHAVREQERILEIKGKPIPDNKKNKQTRLVQRNFEGAKTVQGFFSPLFKREDKTTVFCWTNEVYYYPENRFLEAKGFMEKGLQNAIIDGEFHGEVATWIIKKMSTDGSINDCSKDTLQLIADAKSSKIVKKGKGRSNIIAGIKTSRDVKLIFGIKNELDERSNEGRKLFEDRVGQKFGVAPQEIKNVMNLYGIHVVDYRKKKKKIIFDTYMDEKSNNPDESYEQHFLTVARHFKSNKESVKKAIRFGKTISRVNDNIKHK